MSVEDYFNKISNRYKSGISSEHSYRGDLEDLLRSLVPDIEVTNEPTKITDCGNPDYVITRKSIPVGFIEAKDIGKDLSSKQYKDQFSRYKTALDNLIITDYVVFEFYQYGKMTNSVNIADVVESKSKLIAKKENFGALSDLLKDFPNFVTQTIKSPKRLSELMAAKARLLENILEMAITSDEETEENTALKDQYTTFKNVLIHDLTPQEFSDIYAQTLAYGMFAARLHDATLDTFSRQEAAELIPKSNPFLRRLFSHVAGVDIDERIRTTVDNLADLFRATNVESLLSGFGHSSTAHDPIIHFYETFLASYDPSLRKARGVWYTPKSVVSFIVKSVDKVLQNEFLLEKGIADTSKTSIRVKTDKVDKRTQSGYVEIDKEVHKVQILDPATGTGTFLAEIVRHIYDSRFKAMKGAWSTYVDDHLIPRLNGFELLMASYSMAHLKLDMLLTETGYNSAKNNRFNVYLTNTLEEHHPDTGTLFSSWLSTEANEANHIKRDTPVMVVLGNPPYAISSSNTGDWILELIKVYKSNLNEKKLNLDDDYIKFIRYGQHLIEKNGEGVLCYISNNSFIDGITHRQMRHSLLSTFSEIYVLDLHGNSKRNEKSPDGSKDENVFDIMQGVSISIFVKKPSNKGLAKINHFDLYGTRKSKYEYLIANDISSVPWKELSVKKPYYFFIPKDFSSQKKYEKGFSITELFLNYNSGIQTKNDKVAIHRSEEDMLKVVEDFRNLEKEDLLKKYNLKDSSGWKVDKAIQDLQENEITVADILYRPFDLRKTILSGKSGGFIGRPRFETNRHVAGKSNLCLITVKQQSTFDFQHALVTNAMIDGNTISMQTREYNYTFPIYLFEEGDLLDEGGERIISNFSPSIIKAIEKKVDRKFDVMGELENSFSAIDLLDYIYAILYSPGYRKKYKEFLKIDYPRVPYPKNNEDFEKLRVIGSKLRDLHLLKSGQLKNVVSTYPVDGNNFVSRKIVKSDWEISAENSELGKIWINDKQYFGDIPVSAWNMYIGGYQPAQKWLKDRSGDQLTFEDISHYQTIIVALVETAKLMESLASYKF